VQRVKAAAGTLCRSVGIRLLFQLLEIYDVAPNSSQRKVTHTWHWSGDSMTLMLAIRNRRSLHGMASWSERLDASTLIALLQCHWIGTAMWSMEWEPSNRCGRPFVGTFKFNIAWRAPIECARCCCRHAPGRQQDCDSGRHPKRGSS